MDQVNRRKPFITFMSVGSGRFHLFLMVLIGKNWYLYKCGLILCSLRLNSYTVGTVEKSYVLMYAEVIGKEAVEWPEVYRRQGIEGGRYDHFDRC